MSGTGRKHIGKWILSSLNQALLPKTTTHSDSQDEARCRECGLQCTWILRHDYFCLPGHPGKLMRTTVERTSAARRTRRLMVDSRPVYVAFTKKALPSRMAPAGLSVAACNHTSCNIGFRSGFSEIQRLTKLRPGKDGKPKTKSPRHLADAYSVSDPSTSHLPQLSSELQPLP